MSASDLPHDVLTLAEPAFALVQRWLIAYALLLARPLAVLSVNPVFSRTELSNLLKGAVATGLIFPMWPPTAAALAHAQAWPGMFAFTLLVIKETMIGIALGLPLGLAFWALLAAGDIIDQQRGATQGRLNDPAGFGDESVTGTLFLLCGIAILATTGQFDMIADTLYTSWAVWRPLEMLPVPEPGAADLALRLLDDLQAEALSLAAPLILAMVLTDTTMLLLARIAPQLRIDDLSLAVRNLAFVIVLPLYAGFFLLYAAGTESRIGQSLQLLRSTIHSSATGTEKP